MTNDTDIMSVSERGLRLIKAFEGFRPVDRVLVTGTRVVGHGHRLMDDTAVIMGREEAHATLLDDLAPFEDMIRETVFAPLTQGQFDALVSLAFNIGPRAFLDSDVLRAVNAGRPLDAAAGFDVWRRAEVAGQTFVVDALVRRRTAEKALFLRPSDDMMAPRAPGSDISARADATVATEMDAPTLDRNGAGRLLADAPYELSRLITTPPTQSPTNTPIDVAITEPRRRRDDGPTGEMALTDLGMADLGAEDLDVTDLDATDLAEPDSLFDGLDSVFDTDDLDDEPNLPASPIAAAADEVRDRLDALMDGGALDSSDTDEPPSFDEIESIEDLIRSGLDVAAGDGGDAVLDLEGPNFDSPDFDEPETDTAAPTPISTLDTPDDPDGPDVVVPFPTRATRLSAPDPVITDRSAPPITKPIAEDVPEFAKPGRDGTELDAPAMEDASTTTINSLAADAALRSRTGGVGNSPDELAHHDWSPSQQAETAASSTAWPYIVLFAIGGLLFGAGAVLLSRGAGDVLGQPRELVGLAAAMIGAMIILGSLLYVLKTTLTETPQGDRT